MTKKKLEACRSGKDFIDYAARRGAEVHNGGRHIKIIGPNGGSCPVPNHPGDLPVGTRHSIIKMLALIGLALMPLACLIAALIS